MYIRVMSEHVTRFFVRLDAHVACLPPWERGPFLRDRLTYFENLYRDWQAKIDSGHAAPPGLEAADFILTIAGLDQRLALQQAIA